jgi:hypothetical protein
MSDSLILASSIRLKPVSASKETINLSREELQAAIYVGIASSGTACRIGLGTLGAFMSDVGAFSIYPFDSSQI